jgi:hypothetical protein
MRTAIFLAILMTASDLAHGQGTVKEYGYIFQESTGQNQYILVGRRRMPITFDKAGSDRIALHALMSLKPSILYGNSRGRSITLLGEYEAQTGVFTLRHWYLRTPFVEWAVKDESRVPHQVTKKVRRFLNREDFTKDERFDPYDKRFNPASFIRRSKLKRGVLQ